MTLNAITLEQYFHLIVNKPPVKEQPMNFLKLSMFFTEQLEKIKNLWTKPVAFVEQEVLEEDYWAFEMYTNEWVDEFGETVPVKHTLTIEPHEGTWMEVIDRVIEEIEKHYGYDIKSRVYYSVEFPVNDLDAEGKPMAGYGRCLNDEVLQQLLLAFPQAYYWTDAGDIYK
jgi:hypothetical protein